MKRQTQKPGVRKWYGNDWTDLQNELYKAIEEGILAKVSNAVLSGCELVANGANFDLSAGIVFIDGNVCFFEGITNSALPIYLTKEIVETDNRVYANLQSLPTEIHYKANATTDLPTGDFITITETRKPELLLIFSDADGNIHGVNISDSLTLNDSNTFASAKAIFLLKAALNQQIDLHIANTSNPHATTKTQVGLGNLPNLISDSYNYDESNSIASSKAVRDLHEQINLYLSTAGSYTNVSPATLTIKGLNGSSIVETITAVAETTMDIAHIPSGSATFFKYKVDRKTVTLMFLIQFPITADNHTDYIRITLPDAIKNVASPTLNWGMSNNNVTSVTTAKGPVFISVKSDHIDIRGMKLDAGVQYSGPGFSYNYTSGEYMTGGLSIAIVGQITYQIN